MIAERIQGTPRNGARRRKSRNPRRSHSIKHLAQSASELYGLMLFEAENQSGKKLFSSRDECLNCFRSPNKDFNGYLHSSLVIASCHRFQLSRRMRFAKHVADGYKKCFLVRPWRCAVVTVGRDVTRHDVTCLLLVHGPPNTKPIAHSPFCCRCLGRASSHSRGRCLFIVCHSPGTKMFHDYTWLWSVIVWPSSRKEKASYSALLPNTINKNSYAAVPNTDLKEFSGLVRILSKLNPRESCKDAFRELGLLTLPCLSLYILEVALYRRLKCELVRGSDVHQYGTRSRDNFRVEQHRTSSFKHLPSQVGFRISKAFYSTDEFMMGRWDEIFEINNNHETTRELQFVCMEGREGSSPVADSIRIRSRVPHVTPTMPPLSIMCRNVDRDVTQRCCQPANNYMTLRDQRSMATLQTAPGHKRAVNFQVDAFIRSIKQCNDVIKCAATGGGARQRDDIDNSVDCHRDRGTRTSRAERKNGGCESNKKCKLQAEAEEGAGPVRGSSGANVAAAPSPIVADLHNISKSVPLSTAGQSAISYVSSLCHRCQQNQQRLWHQLLFCTICIRVPQTQ
ncbi:hypothetical protein J6590_073107 [Homalodisca vitripennis]|nr:hypothetical protein J6590_073107 [Homalodisca vitripennis]